MAGYRDQQAHQHDAAASWALLRPLLVGPGPRLGPVELLALRELLEARQAVARTRYLLRVGSRILLFTAGAALVVVVADTVREGLADKPTLFGELLTGNFVTFLVGAGGPVGLLLTQAHGTSTRLAGALAMAQKLGLHATLQQLVSEMEGCEGLVDELWAWLSEAPERAPGGPARPVASQPSGDAG